MTVFGKYSHYYNFLYQDKDYASEADYIEILIQKYHPNAKTILDMGCGTGQHAKFLAQKGFKVCGVDFSEEMLKIANELADGEQLTFYHRDIRNFRLKKSFDVVISLFHVMSYQPKNSDLQRAFTTAYEHLNDHGLLIFDCWYGPAVLTDRPTVKIKHFEDNSIKITRLSEPVMYANENIVEVNFLVFVYDKKSKRMEEFKETHRMRYLFKPELELLLGQVGFKIERYSEFMTDNEPDYTTWNVCFVGRKK